ncbi:MAG: glycosyltransferase family 4 protein [Solirubrobacterales bacterium]
MDSVAHLGPDPAGGGGMAVVIRGLLASPLRRRYEMEMIVTYRDPRPLPRARTFLAAMAQLITWSRRTGRGLLHVHSAARGSLYRKSLVVFLARLLRRPVLLHIHAGMGDIEAFAGRIDRLSGWIFHRSLRAATRVLAVSSESARMTERCFGVEGILVVPNSAPPVPAGARPLEPGAGAEDRVLYLGGFHNRVKGGEHMLAAVAELAPELPEVTFALAGPGEPPARLAQLEREHPNVEWLGWLDEEAKQRELSRSAVFVLSSTSEGLPVALLEALSWGRAVVATEIGGVPDVVSDGREAVLVPPADPGALAAAVGALLADPERCRRLGEAARSRAATINDEEVCGRLDALYREVLA